MTTTARLLPSPCLFRRATKSGVASSMIVAALTLGAWTSALAARTFPANSRQVKISQVADDAIVADGRTLHLAPGVVIFTTTNSTLVRGALPANVIARVQVDLNGDVRRIWLLADDEILVRPWWQFWKSDQPQAGE